MTGLRSSGTSQGGRNDMAGTWVHRVGPVHLDGLESASVRSGTWRCTAREAFKAAQPIGELTMRRRPSPRTVLAIASLGGAVAFIDATIVNIAFPDIARSFPGTSISTLSWILNAYNIVFAAFLMAAAGIADLLGRRRVFVFGLELFTVGSLLCAIAPSPDALIDV